METKNQTIEIQGIVLTPALIKIIENMQMDENEYIHSLIKILYGISDMLIDLKGGIADITEKEFLESLSYLRKIREIISDLSTPE